jgi:hypothetical protein
MMMVLAPELATMLIMEDMNVDAERAREIMRESVELGDLLNSGEAWYMSPSSSEIEFGSDEGSAELRSTDSGSDIA